jgi:hypothetical protein
MASLGENRYATQRSPVDTGREGMQDAAVIAPYAR